MQTMNIDFIPEMVNDKNSKTILQDRFCMRCGNELISANLLSKKFVDKIRVIEGKIAKESKEIEKDRNKNKNDKIKSIGDNKKILKELNVQIDEALKKTELIEKERTDIKNKTEYLIQENLEIEKRIKEYEKKKEIANDNKEIPLSDPKQLLNGLTGTERYNVLINLNVYDMENELQTIGSRVYLRFTPNDTLEETDEKGIKFYISETENSVFLYPSNLIKYVSGRKEYEDFYHYEGEGQKVHIKDVCSAKKIGSIYIIEKIGKIVFERG